VLPTWAVISGCQCITYLYIYQHTHTLSRSLSLALSLSLFLSLSLSLSLALSLSGATNMGGDIRIPVPVCRRRSELPVFASQAHQVSKVLLILCFHITSSIKWLYRFSRLRHTKSQKSSIIVAPYSKILGHWLLRLFFLCLSDALRCRKRAFSKVLYIVALCSKITGHDF
jgi:hypothetical protein